MRVSEGQNDFFHMICSDLPSQDSTWQVTFILYQVYRKSNNGPPSPQPQEEKRAKDENLQGK